MKLFIYDEFQSGGVLSNKILKDQNGRANRLMNQRLAGYKLCMDMRNRTLPMNPCAVIGSSHDHIEGEIVKFDEAAEDHVIKWYKEHGYELIKVEIYKVSVYLPIKPFSGMMDIPEFSWKKGKRLLLNQALYGTLRKDQSNYRWAKKGISENLTVTNIPVPFYEMYYVWDEGSYPISVRTGDAKDVIEVDLMQFHDQEIAMGVAAMEWGAGYHLGSVNYDGEEFGIWLQNKESVVGKKKVNGGIWKR